MSVFIVRGQMLQNQWRGETILSSVKLSFTSFHRVLLLCVLAALRQTQRSAQRTLQIRGSTNAFCDCDTPVDEQPGLPDVF